MADILFNTPPGAGGGGGAAFTVSAGANSISSGSLVFSNSNNITFGMAGSTITASATFAGGVAAFAGGVSTGGNTAGNTGTVASQLVLAGGNNITLSGSTNGSSMTVTVSGPNQSNQTGGVYFVGNTTGESSSSTNDVRTLSFHATGPVSMGWSLGSIRVSVAPGFSAGGAASSFNSLVFQDSNGIAWGNNAGSLRITQNFHTLSAIGNTSNAASVSGTFDHANLHISGHGVASVGMSGNTLVVNVPAGGGAGDGGNFIAAGTRTAGTNSTVLFSNANGVTFGLDAVNGSIITASVNAGGGAAETISTLRYNPPFAYSSTQVSAFHTNTVGAASFFPINVDDYVNADYVKMMISASNLTTSVSHAGSGTLAWQLYTVGTGASSTALFGVGSSGSLTWAYSMSSVSGTLTWYTSTAQTDYSSGSLTWSATSQNASNINGVREIHLLLGTTLSKGVDYFLGVHAKRSSVNSSHGFLFSYLGGHLGNPLVANMAAIGQTTQFTGSANALRSQWFLPTMSYATSLTDFPGSTVSLTSLMSIGGPAILPFMVFEART